MERIREGRHLAAIMFVDMVGYSARMQKNEPRTIVTVQDLWAGVRPLLAEHGGREVDLAGDGMLMEFPGALAAVRCALALHQQLHEKNRGMAADDRVIVRAGVHLGDVEHRDGRIFGDGVNIAARVIGLSPPGAIAMTPHVRDQLLNVLEQAPQSLGVRKLKNIAMPLELWCLPGPDCRAADLAVARRDDESADRRWTFGNAVFDERTLELAVNGEAVSLEKKSLDVLVFLLQHAGEVVTKDEILDSVWSDRILSETVLTKCISRIREALGDADQQIIRTMHGFGYRLAVPVSVETRAADEAPHFDFRPGDRPPLRPLWSLAERLGAGGHGEAWLARHDKTGEARVFKFALEADALASLKREITLYRVLKDSLGDDAGFARILDWNLEDPPYFLESEYINGGNLQQWLERQGGAAAVPLDLRLELAAQIAESLAAAHSVGVLHKDLKPANVLVDESGGTARIRLCDFGSGGVLDQKRLDEIGITRMGFTKTLLDTSGSSSATPFYLAPEVIGGQPFTVQADIFSLGVMLYQIAVGDLRRSLEIGWETDVSDELLREDIAAAAAGNPAQRLTDAGQLAQRLRTLETRRAERVRQREALAQAEKAEQMRGQLRRMRLAAGALVMVVVAIGGAGLYAYQARNEALRAVATTEAVSNFLANDVLLVSNPWQGRMKDLTVKDLIDRSTSIVGERLAEQPEAEARVRLALGGAYSWLNQQKAGLEQVRLAAARLEESFGRSDRRTLAALNELGRQLMTQPDLASMREAHALLVEVLKFLEKEHPDEVEEILAAREWLSHLLLQLGRHNEALELYIGLLREKYPDDGPDYDSNSEYQFGLSRFYLRAGRFPEAEDYSRRSVQGSARKNGDDHYFTGWARLRLGQTLTQVGKYGEAEILLERGRQDLENWLGRDHHQAIGAREMLGFLRLEQRRPAEALKLYEEVLERCARADCGDRAEIVNPHNLARAYLGVRRFADAEKVLRDALARDEANGFSAGYWRLIRDRTLLAETRLAQGDAAGARTILGEIGYIHDQPLGHEHGHIRSDHPEILAELRRIQGLMLMREKQTAAALDALRESLELYETRLGPSHWRTQRARQEFEQVRTRSG
jgi:eukaryotic-like serine/threonine-protein kinase